MGASSYHNISALSIREVNPHGEGGTVGQIFPIGGRLASRHVRANTT